MSLLSSQRKRGQHGLSTTRAGTPLKQQIPIRTFEAWKETRPGFLEADLVAHCGALPHIKSAFVVATYTAFCFFKKDRKADMVLLNRPEILCDVWSLKR